MLEKTKQQVLFENYSIKPEKSNSLKRDAIETVTTRSVTVLAFAVHWKICY